MATVLTGGDQPSFGKAGMRAQPTDRDHAPSSERIITCQLDDVTAGYSLTGVSGKCFGGAISSLGTNAANCC